MVDWAESQCERRVFVSPSKSARLDDPGGVGFGAFPSRNLSGLVPLPAADHNRSVHLAPQIMSNSPIPGGPGNDSPWQIAEKPKLFSRGEIPGRHPSRPPSLASPHRKIAQRRRGNLSRQATSPAENPNDSATRLPVYPSCQHPTSKVGQMLKSQMAYFYVRPWPAEQPERSGTIPASSHPSGFDQDSTDDGQTVSNLDGQFSHPEGSVLWVYRET